MDRLIVPKTDRLILPAGPMLATRAMPRHELVDLRSLGILPGIAGGARGYNQAGDIITQTADGRDLNQVWADFQAALAQYNAERDRLMAILTFNVTNPIEDVFQGGDTVDFEIASEFGEPVGVRPAVPAYFSLGYGFRWYDVAVRYTWQYLADVDSRQLDVVANMILEADNRLLFTQTMKQLFNNVTRVATIQSNNYNVYPLYNGDSTVPPKYKGAQPASPHTHYLVTNGATVDSGDLLDIEDHLKHHGYTWANGTALAILCNSAQSATIQTFRVATGAKYDFIQASGAPDWAMTLNLTADAQLNVPAPPPSVWRGLEVIGRWGPFLIIEEDLVPAGYLLGVAFGGDLDARNPVGIREHANASLRGLRLVKGTTPDYPLIDSFYQRGFGTGIRQRGAAVISQVKASGSYDIPAAFA